MSFFTHAARLLRRLFGQRTEQATEPRTATYPAPSGLVAVTTPAESRAGDAREEAHHAFIVAHWTKLAAAAYIGFQRHGIGVVVVEPRERASDADHPFASHTLAYATGMGMWTQRPPHSAAPDWLEKQFQTYEPLETGLFLFKRGDGPPRPYRAEGTLTPPEAMKQAQAPFN